MKKKMISVLFAVIFAFLLVAEEVIPAQAADNAYYNIQFQIIDTQNNVNTFFVPHAAPIGARGPFQGTWKLNETGQVGPYISNANMTQFGMPQTLEFTVTGICSEVVVNSTVGSCKIYGNKVVIQMAASAFTAGSTLNIVISGKHEPITNSITTQPATCTTKGQEIAICSKCQQQYVYRILPVDPNRHGGKSIKKIDKDATCTEAGQYHYECEKCGTTTIGKQTIPAKGHTWTDSGSGLVCSVCGKKSEAKASGMYYGIPWEMDADGNLTLKGGTCTDTHGTEWKAVDVKTVKCDGEIICNKYFCNSLFYQNTNLISADLSGFDTSNVTNMYGMFNGCSSLTALNLSSFDTSNVTDMGYMFGGCESLTLLDLSNFDTSNVTNMYSMFYNCQSLTSLDVSSFNTGNVRDMHTMFYKCSNLTSLDLSNFDTTKVTNIDSMFAYCSALITLDISNFNTSNVTSMNSMFFYCDNLTSLDLSSFDTSNVIDMCGMFKGCTSLTSLDLSSFDTSNVIYMNGMFNDCSSLTALNLSSFDTSNVTNISSMFEDCRSLKSLDLSNFNTSKVTSAYKMFLGCDKLEVLITPKTVGTTNIELPFTMYDKNGNEYNKITVTNTKLYKDPQFKIFVNKTVRIKGIAIGSRKIRVRY